LKPRGIFRLTLGAFLAIVLFTTLAGVGIEYLSTRRDLPGFFVGIRAQWVASYLEAVYSREGDWTRAGREIEYLFTLEATGVDGDSDGSFRYVVRDAEGRSLYNSFDTITSLSSESLVEGDEVEIPDYASGGVAGTVTVYLGEAYLAEETRRYLVALLGTRLRQQLLLSLSALVLAYLLSRRIAHPLVRLTQAIERVSEPGMPTLEEIRGPREVSDLAWAFGRMTQTIQHQKEVRAHLVADLAHDINNPLHAILLEARALQDRLSSPEEAARGILAEVHSLRNVVYDLEWMAQVETGEYRIEKTQIDLEQLLLDLGETWSPRALREKRSLKFPTDSLPVPQFSADAPKLARALGNLIENALRYNKAGTGVEVRVSAEPDFLVFTVWDDGEPIGADIRETIFERNVRGDFSDPSKGRGLGLAIVRHIAELHGGAVYLEKNNPLGNSFIVKVPLF